jgi:hypothetical protein
MVLRRWATRDLRRGDLTTLAAIASGSVIDPNEKLIQRLKRRHFVIEKLDGEIMLSFRGRMALIIRRAMRH